jgi:predicted Zn-dependent peptidase
MIDRTIAPDVHPFGKLNIPEETIEILPSGITLHTLSGGDQAVTRLSLYWKGSTLELPLPIIPTLASELLREGTKTMTGAEIADKLDLYGAILGTSTSNHYNGLVLNMLNNKAKLIMPVIKDMFTNPIFPENAVEAIKMRTINQLRYRHSQVDWVANKHLTKLIAGEEHPMAVMPNYAGYEAIKLDDIVTYYNKAFCSRGLHIYASGQITDEIRSLIEDLAAAVPVGDGYELNVKPFDAQSAQTKYVEHGESLQCAVAMALPAISRTHEDYLPLQLTVLALGGYFGSRLMANIREEKGYTYGISSGLNGSQEGGYISISAQCDPKYTDALIEEVGKELERMVTEPPCGDELQRLTLNAATKLAGTLESPFSIMDFYKLRETVGTPLDYFEKRQEAIASLTPEVIAAMSAKYLKPSDLRIAIAGPAK